MASNCESPPADNIVASVKARQRIMRLKRRRSPPAGATPPAASSAAAPATPAAMPASSAASHSASASTSKRAGPYGWSTQEKLFFFEALRLFGKNFPEVSRHIRRRVRRFSLTFKSREQCRLFYFRSWQYVKKHLRVQPDVPNLTMELYGLINYSVIYGRVKLKLNARLGEKLNELVQTGFTTLRFRGKRLVLRTPCCPALKRLNGIEDPKQEYRVAETLQLELTPRTSASFHRVQGCAQNPNVRLLVSANRQLGEVLALLEAKWRSSLARLRQELRLPLESAPKLTARLPEGTSLEEAVGVATVARCRYQDISLDAYMDRLRRASNGGAATSAPPPPPEDDPVRLELMEVGAAVAKGVDAQAASRVKILALHLALGCPAKIQLEYDYFCPGELETDKASPRNLFNNAMRRLLHLCRTQQTTFKTMDEEVVRLKEEKESLAVQVERSRRTACLSCGCVPEDLSGEAGGPGSGGGGGGEANSGASAAQFRRPRAVYPRPSPRERAALQQLTQVASRTGPVPIVVQRELQIDANTEPEMKPVCAKPQSQPQPAPQPQMAVRRDRVRRQQPLIMHKGTRGQAKPTPPTPPSPALVSNGSVDLGGSGSCSNSSNIIHRAFRIAMAGGEPPLNQGSQDSFDALLSKMGASRSLLDPDKTSLPPPTPPPAHLGDVSPHPAHHLASDHSLTAFGSLLESPVKGGFAGDSQDSMVGRAVDALMTESSADYCRKFADLADRITSADA